MKIVDDLIQLLGGVTYDTYLKASESWFKIYDIQVSKIRYLQGRIDILTAKAQEPPPARAENTIQYEPADVQPEKAARATASHNLRPVLARLLRIVPCTTAELAAKTGATKKAVLDTLARMERAGLVFGDEVQYWLTVPGTNYAREALGRPDAKHVHMPKAAAEVTR